MAIFDYTLPSGSQFRLEAPAGTTQVQADRIFYEQVAAGSLIGYQTGQSLTSIASRVTKFELSRLDRGTAGVDTTTVLSIVQNLPLVSGIPELVNVQLENPINETDIVLAKGNGLGPDPVGPLTAFQVQALQAQLANIVNQPANAISLEKGIGKYGLNCLQLEKLGYIKPGTYARFLESDPDNFVGVMYSPAIWTGLDGITSLSDLLNDEDAQNVAQNQLMQISYQSLVDAGIISNVPTASISLSQGQIYTPAGLQPLNAFNLLGIGTGVTTNAAPALTSNSLASGAISNFAFAQTAIGITNKINGDIGALVNNASKYSPLAAAAWANSGGIPNFSSLVTGNLNLPTLPNLNLSQITGGLTGLVPGGLGALTSGLDTLGKASQFGITLANPLASIQNINLQGLATGAVSRVQGLATGALGNIQGQLTGLAGNLQGQVTGALGNLQGQLSRLTGLFSGAENLVSSTQIAAGFSNTVNRKTVDAAVTRILGNPKISAPGFEFPSPAVLAERLDIRQAQNILQGLRQQGNQVLNQVSQLQGQATRLGEQAASTFNRVIG